MENLLPEIDIEYLNGKGYDYDIVASPSCLYLILKGIDIPEIYSERNADIMIQIPAGYPNAQLDMFWTYPELKYVNGTYPQATEHRENHVGRNWQRWSRHAPWRAGVDNLKTFITSILIDINKQR